MIPWIVRSSADPRALSLAFRGILLALVPVIMLATGLAEGDILQLIEAVTNIVFWATSIASAVMFAVGILRKVELGRYAASDRG